MICVIIYKVEENLEPSVVDTVEDYTGDLVAIMSTQEAKQKSELYNITKESIPKFKDANFCKATVHTDFLSATFSILSKDQNISKNNFAFIYFPGKLIFIDDEDHVATYIKKMNKDKYHGGIKIGRFLYDFLEIIIESDLRYIEEMANRLTKIESAIIRGVFSEFNKFMFKFKKEILSFYRYYTQLSDLSDELQENENGFFSDEDIEYFGKFSKRVEKLRDEARFLRETSNQLRDVYHSSVDSKNNEVMKFLTVVTTLVTPLTICSSWYGMNFVYMPELSSPYGYIGFIIFNIVVLVICTIILKKKKLL